mmetsp:Transcript_13436/g.13185  ORF Transcript_13436/g.13185 Transcript_13436/m.13185 type:complete len:112 (+) Transcript_13436:1223-1558(+)
MRIERDFLNALNFEMEVVTTYDFHTYFIDLLQLRMEKMERVEQDMFAKISELSMLLIRMALQNVDYQHFSASELTASAIYASIGILRGQPFYSNDAFYLALTKELMLISRS